MTASTDATHLRMFDKWPCNTFKPNSHITARYDEMHMVGVDICAGYFGVMKPRKGHEEWSVALSDGATWKYRTLSELLSDWRIAKSLHEVIASRRAKRTLFTA